MCLTFVLILYLKQKASPEGKSYPLFHEIPESSILKLGWSPDVDNALALPLDAPEQSAATSASLIQ